MVIRLKRTPKPVEDPKPKPPGSARMANMSEGEVYLICEAALMSGMQNLSLYRSAPRAEQPALLNWLKADMSTAEAALAELLSRKVDVQ